MHWYLRKGLDHEIFLAPSPEKLQHKMVEENTGSSSPGAIRLLTKEIRSSIISTRTGKQPNRSLQYGPISPKSVSRRKMPNIVQNEEMGEDHCTCQKTPNVCDRNRDSLRSQAQLPSLVCWETYQFPSARGCRKGKSMSLAVNMDWKWDRSLKWDPESWETEIFGLKTESTNRYF